MKNRSFRTTLEYVLGKEKAELLESNMGGTTPRQLAKEFGAARKLRPNLQRACGHIILSMPHREADHEKGEYHEHLDNDQYVEIAQRWLKAMNFLKDEAHLEQQTSADSQYAIARHHDTNHEHVHIIASRIRMDGSVVPDSWDYRRSEVVVRQLEKEFGLSPTPCSNDQVADIVKEQGIDATTSERKAQTHKQKHHSSGKPPITQLLANAIDEATADQPTVTQLIGRLQRQGITVHPTFSTRGLFREAVAFEMSGVKVAGNKLGAAYSFPGLQKKRGVSYDSERDMPAILAAAAGESISLSESDIDKKPVQNATGEKAKATVIDDKQREQLALQEELGREQWGSVLPDSTNSTVPPRTLTPTPTTTSAPTPFLVSAQAPSLTSNQAQQEQQQPATTSNEAADSTNSTAPPRTLTPSLTSNQAQQQPATLPTEQPQSEQQQCPRDTLKGDISSTQQHRPGEAFVGNGSALQLQLPFDTKAKRAYLDKIYQQLKSQIRKQTDLKLIDDVDVGVALLGLLEGLGADDIKLILLRSPKGQYFKQVGSPFEEFSDYAHERVAISQTYQQLKAAPEQGQRVDFVKPIVEEFFKTVDDGQQLEGTHYTLKRFGDTRSVIANDGRGEVLRLNGRWVEKASLTDEDVLLWQRAEGRRRWQQYTQGLSEVHPIERDEIASRLALKSGHSEEATREMLFHSPYYQQLQQQQGEESADRYASQVLAAAKLKNKMQQQLVEQKAGQRSKEQERKRSGGLEL